MLTNRTNHLRLFGDSHGLQKNQRSRSIYRLRLVCEMLEVRSLLSITLNGFPQWHEEGPGPIAGSNFVAGMDEFDNPPAGAIEAVAALDDDAHVLYIGSVTGGVWKTINATAERPTWTPLTDHLPSLSIGAVAISSLDRNVIYAGTGRL
jgi:hypothetical protein